MSDAEDHLMPDEDHPMPDHHHEAAPEPMDGVEPTTSTTKYPPSTSQFLPHHIPTEAELDVKYPHRPKNPNPTLPFHTLHENLFEPLLSNKKKVGVGGRGFKNLKPHEVRRGIIERFIAMWKEKVGPDLYPAFRLIMPDKDRDRTVYGLKEKTIGKLLVKLMKINKTSDDALALLNWRLPGRGSASSSSSTGDFAGRCYEIIKKRPMRTTPGDLTVADVNDMLDQLSASSKEEQQLPIFNELYNNMNATELMWVIRIILKQMKVGATEKTFFAAFHHDAETLFNVSSSLKRVCWELHTPTIHLDSTEKGVTLLSCFQPQLAQFQKRSLEDTVRIMQKGGAEQFWIEEKLDGERMQMHMSEGAFRWWSRKAKDYTYLYGGGEGYSGEGEGEEGDLGSGGSLVRYLQNAFDPGVKSIILDGEMITWDPTLDCIVAFGTLKTACIAQAKSPFDTTCHRPLFRVFDILYLNGESLVNYTLQDRRRALSRSVRSVHRRLEIHNYTPASTAQEIEDSLRKVVAEASEGLVIKNPLSIYRLNERNDDWMKVKPEYMTEFGEDLDCLIVGGYYGSGRRGGFLSSFLCALRVDGSFRAPGDPENKFWSFFKVGGGLTAADYTKIQHMTRDKWMKFDPRKPPKDVIELAGGPLQYERPDEWIRPEDSLVVAVKAAQVAVSDQFRMGKTLRFPRFKAFREDKDWRSALSVTEFLNLQAKVDKQYTEKMNVEKKVRRGAGAGPRKKREIVVIGQEGVGTVVNAEDEGEGVTTPFAGPETMVFDGLCVFIMTDSVTPGYKKSKHELEQLVKRNGGRFFQSERAVEGIRLVGDKKTVKVSAVIKAGKGDVIRPMWLLDSLKQFLKDRDGLLPLEPKYLLHAYPETQEAAERNIDEWGDSYCRDVEGEELQYILESSPVGEINLAKAGGVRDEVFGSSREEEGDRGDEVSQLPGWTLARCVAYIDVPEEEEEGKEKVVPLGLRIAEQLLMFAGARVVASPFEGGVTHVVVDKDNGGLERVKALRGEFAERMEEGGRIPWVVGIGWVEECVRERTWVDEGKWVV
ncbi:DNA ligase 4 [Terfezia boudieri ATCC MYA-4762]|uniref:DNA ligase n=1 Tax=Terfezia boudieri ATCC MYA-4762 TaxID=1051890 RepID=A0A3N4M3X6_9PEZI|nr:DNA ligase 4 [Terfezia boudieri ATCC MYA-4762]